MTKAETWFEPVWRLPQTTEPYSETWTTDEHISDYIEVTKDYGIISVTDIGPVTFTAIAFDDGTSIQVEQWDDGECFIRFFKDDRDDPGRTDILRRLGR